MKPLASLFGAILLLGATSPVLAETSVRAIALFTDKALLEVNGEQKVVSKGETFSGVLLQSASARSATVVIEGETLDLKPNQEIAGNFKKREKVSLRITPDDRGMYYTRGKINGYSINFLVDTGATNVTLSGQLARRLKIDFKQGVRGRAQTASGIVTSWNVRLASVDVGGIKLSNVPATVIDGEHPAQVLLGNSFLSHTRMQKAGSTLEISKRF